MTETINQCFHLKQNDPFFVRWPFKDILKSDYVAEADRDSIFSSGGILTWA